MNKLISTVALAIPIVLFSQPSYAYLDPGTGAFLIQALLGGVAGIMVVGRIYWSRIKAFFRRSPAKTPETLEASRVDEV